MASYSLDQICDLVDGKLPWSKLKSMMSIPKDVDRFDKYVEVLQAKVPWPERILLPLAEHLYIVEQGEDFVVKCDCGFVFGDYRRNWKLSALIEVLDSAEKLDELYAGPGKPDARFCQIRQFYCPGCATQLEVEAVTVGEPAIFEFLPDIDGFYAEWLKRPLSRLHEFRDLSGEVTRDWAEGRDQS